MTFTVEDGTGLINSNAYVSVEFVDAYFSDRGITTWTGITAVKQNAIIKATDYIETVFGNKFLGNKEFPEVPQALSFPRLNLYDREGYLVEGIPVNLQKATAEYARRALTTTLLPDPTSDATGQIVSRKKTKVGPLETETEYRGTVILKAYPTADKLLSMYISASGRVWR